MQALDGSVIYQILDDGSLFGGDDNGRTCHLTTWLHKIGWFKDECILDLGSNAGHFPIEYIRAGAKHVTAVDGRLEFKKQWDRLRTHIPAIDTNRIAWHISDVREYIPTERYTVVSCLGLIHHVENIWPTLVRIATSDVHLIVIEAKIYDLDKRTGPFEEYNTEVRTGPLKREMVTHDTSEGIKDKIHKFFPDWALNEVWQTLRAPATFDRISQKLSINPSMRCLLTIHRQT